MYTKVNYILHNEKLQILNKNVKHSEFNETFWNETQICLMIFIFYNGI